MSKSLSNFSRRQRDRVANVARVRVGPNNHFVQKHLMCPNAKTKMPKTRRQALVIFFFFTNRFSSDEKYRKMLV